MRDSYSENITPENFGHIFLHGHPENIYKQCSKEFKEIITLQQFAELVQFFNENVESYQLSHSFSIAGTKQFLWLDSRKEKSISVAFDSFNTIQSILIKPYLTFPKSDQRYSKNAYTMPIKEDWFVFWGGKNEFLNYHYAYESQRYAYDLVIVKENQTYKDNQIRNENYYAFNKEVAAPADGTVVKVVNYITDNTPGEMNELEPAGNYVVLKHINNEYSLLAHFKQYSIVVKEGQEVKQGELIGLCGNSGHSSEPHIHFQVMNSPDLENCKSICIRFSDGQEPIQGVTISQSIHAKDTASSKKHKLDRFDKGEILLFLTEVIPRFFVSFFK